MALIVKDGDVFKQGFDVVMHQANCYNTMGSGIAKTIRENYPEAYHADSSFPFPVGKGRLGKFSWSWVAGGEFRIFSLYGQLGYGRGKKYTNYEALESALRGALSMLSVEEGFKNLKIGIPYKMGCDRGGGNWDIVSEMINKVSDEFGIDIVACRLKYVN